jgi:hypothetical protein
MVNAMAPCSGSRVAAALLVGTIAGCGGGAAGTADTQAAVTHSPFGVFSAHVVLKGEMKVTGTFTDSLTARHETCDAYAEGKVPATTLFVVPTPHDTSNVNGHSVMYTAGIPITSTDTGYHGPGTYTGVAALVSVLIIDNASYLPGNDAAATITVGPDGSGSLSFSGLLDVDTNAAESGVVTWACSG